MLSDDDRGAGSMVLLTRLAKVVYRRSTEELLGMRLRHFITLSSLRDRGCQPQAEMCELLGMDANNLVLLLNSLEVAEGHVQRRRDPADRRRHLVELTPAGRRALGKRAERAQESIEDEVLATLSAEERATLHELLSRALAASAQRSADAPAPAPAGAMVIAASPERPAPRVSDGGDRLCSATARAASRVLRSRQAIVIGPTPPGTGVIAPARSHDLVEGRRRSTRPSSTPADADVDHDRSGLDPCPLAPSADARSQRSRHRRGRTRPRGLACASERS